MNAPKNALQSEPAPRSPFLFTSQAFVGKMIERGFELDIELRNKLYILASAYTPTEYPTLAIFWKECALESLIDIPSKYDMDEIRHLLILFCVLEKYKVNYVNIVILFMSMSVQQKRNLYRHYYLEWVKCVESLEMSNKTIEKTQWSYTPREFGRLGTDQLRTAWHRLIEMFLHSNEFAKVVFFINQFYMYMAPFV